MSLLFSMSLAGSLVLLLYFIIRPAAMRYLPATWRYWLLKGALLFYLVPYQYPKYKYMAIWSFFFPGQQLNPNIRGPYVTANISRMILVDSNGHLHFENQALIFTVLGAWIILAMVYLIYHLIKYADCMKDLQQIIKLLITLPDTANEYCTSGKPVRAKVSLLVSQHITTPFTVGLLSSHIILPASLVNKKEYKMVISHELAHARNHDNLIKFLCLLAILLHWYNPFIYILYWEICKVSEQVCDAAVIQNMSKQEIEQYKLLIIELGKREPHIDVLWTSPFNGRFKMIKERMIVMNKSTSSKGIRIAASLMMAVLLLALSPISVLAYSPAPTYECQDQPVSDHTVYTAPKQADFQSVCDPFLEYGIEHDLIIYVDDQPYMFADTDQIDPQIFCSHKWVDCYVYGHTKQDDGGCTLYCYDAQMCTLCHSHRNITLYSTTNYTKCPHDIP